MLPVVAISPVSPYPLTQEFGAGEGNRTLIISLEGCCSTIELHPLLASLLSWWRELDSNQRRHSQRVYSPSPLATRASLRKYATSSARPARHNTICTGIRSLPTNHRDANRSRVYLRQKPGVNGRFCGMAARRASRQANRQVSRLAIRNQNAGNAANPGTTRWPKTPRPTARHARRVAGTLRARGLGRVYRAQSCCE